MRHAPSAILCVSLLLAASRADAAAIVYEQLPGPNSSALFNSSTLDGLGNPPGFTSADDFILGAGAIITDLSWWGRSVEGGDDFLFTFVRGWRRRSRCGAPHNRRIARQGRRRSGFPRRSGDLVLVDPDDALRGRGRNHCTAHSSVFNGAADASWNWLVADAAGNGARQGTNPGPPWDRPASDLAFQLATTVPEPATIAIVGAGLALVAARRRTRARP